MQKTGQIERTIDNDYATEEAKFKVYVSHILPPQTLGIP